MPTEETRRRVAQLLQDMQDDDLFQFENCVPLQVNSKGSNNDTPLIVALVREELQSVIDLLEMGADPNAIGEDDFSALHWAARRGPEFVRVLLTHGAVPQGKKHVWRHAPGHGAYSRRSRRDRVARGNATDPTGGRLNGLARKSTHEARFTGSHA